MKTRDSGMPEETWWESFFSPDDILDALGLDIIHGPVVDVGCGYGTFTLAVARHTAHSIIAIDIEPAMVELVQRKAVAARFAHVTSRVVDVMDGSLAVVPNTADVVLLFNLLHCERPRDLLAASKAALRQGGRVAIIHWRSDTPTPRGPDLSIRPKPETIVDWLKATGFAIARAPLVLPPYHFGVVGQVIGDR